MNLTNQHGLPDMLVRAIESNWYSGEGEKRFASVTQLLKPTKQLILEKRHAKALKQDASDMIWSLLGSAVHKVIEAAEDVNSLSEERLRVEIDGAVITGGVDFYEDGVISDFKFTGVWNHGRASRIAEWEKQLNMYAYLYRQNGFPVKKLQVVAIFRDWNRARCEKDADYPEQVETIDIAMWNDDQTRAFIASRIEDIRQAMQFPDDFIPPCTAAERWQSEPQYAVYKTGGKRALRVFPTMQEAEGFLANHKDAANLHIVTREDTPKRCMNYCAVNQFCHYYRDVLALPIPKTA